MTTLYRKQGRRYIPVAEHDPAMYDSLPKGAHLVVVEPGLKSTRYNVNPEHAPLLAALRAHREKLLEVMRNASKQMPARPLTRVEVKAWQAYCEVMGHECMMTMTRASAGDLIDALEKSLVEACK